VYPLKNVDKEKFEKINPELSFKNFFPRFFWFIVNLIKYKTVYFFDANIIVRSSKERQDKRMLKLFTITNRYFLADPVYFEVNRLLDKSFKFNTRRKFKTMSIKLLKERRPESCPLYHNFLLGMHNPAIINSPSFMPELIISQIIKEKNISKEENVIWDKLIGAINKGKNRSLNIFNEATTQEENIIDEAFSKAIKKKRSSIINEDSNYLNDQKSIALALTYALLDKKNVFLVSSDYDLVYSFICVTEHIVQQIIFLHFIGKAISEDPCLKERILKEEKVTLYIKKEEFDKVDNDIRSDVFSRDWKKAGFKFGIKFWHTQQQKYYNHLYLNFDEKTLDMLTHLHGGFNCPFVRNVDYFNWFKLQYFWPPSPSDIKNNVIKIELRKKDNLYRETVPVPWQIHYTKCFYSSAEQGGVIKKNTSFRENNLK